MENNNNISYAVYGGYITTLVFSAIPKEHIRYDDNQIAIIIKNKEPIYCAYYGRLLCGLPRKEYIYCYCKSNVICIHEYNRRSKSIYAAIKELIDFYPDPFIYQSFFVTKDPTDTAKK